MKKIISILSGLALTFVFVTSVSAADSSNLVGWWKLDEESGPVLDSTTPANDGENYGALTNQEGYEGTSYLFDNNDYVSVPDSDDLDITDEITIEAWVKANSVSGYRTILSKRSGSYSNYSFRLWNGRMQFYYRSPGDSNWSEWYSNSTTAYPNDGVWHYVAVTYDYSDYTSLTIYVDDDVYTESDGTWNYGVQYDVDSNTYPVTIGNSYASGGQAFAGYIDDVRLWNAALTTDELELVNPFDMDNDGVLYEDDLCPGTDADIFEVGLGTNRWMWDGEGWITNSPENKNGKANGPNPGFTIEDTMGCSCTQILDSMSSTLGEDFEGHYKYMCSKSIIEDWMSGEYYVGPTYLETVTVPSNQSMASAVSEISPEKDYILNASGTYVYASWAGDPVADAKCSYRGDADPLGYSGQWLSGDLLPSPYTHYLEVRVNDNIVDWGVPYGTCNSDNSYTMNYTGVDHLSFNIFDGNAIGDNIGSISIDILEDKWVDLW